MSEPILGAAPPPAPRATHEFRLEEEIRGQGYAYLRFRDGDGFAVVALVPAPTVLYIGVLVELARPFLGGGAEVPVAPTNAAIAATLGYQVATIRDAISDLYRQAGLARGTSEQRAELVRLAIRERAVTPEDVI